MGLRVEGQATPVRGAHLERFAHLSAAKKMRRWQKMTIQYLGSRMSGGGRIGRGVEGGERMVEEERQRDACGIELRI